VEFFDLDIPNRIINPSNPLYYNIIPKNTQWQSVKIDKKISLFQGFRVLLSIVNCQKPEQIRPQDIVRWIADESGIPGNIIGMINIYDKFTFVEVPEEHANRVLSCMHQNIIKGRKVNVEPAKAR
jgi:hypothetical protein